VEQSPRLGRGGRALARLRGVRRAEVDQLGEPTALPVLAVVTAALLYATLPGRFIHGSAGWLEVVRFVVPALTIPLMLALAVTSPHRHVLHTVRRRTLAVGVTALVTAANSASIVLLVHIVTNGRATNGAELVRASIHMWCTNVLAFALWFWQLDGGGPIQRRDAHAPHDFLFPQQATPELDQPAWQPHFLDYLYLAFTNATAFSPTDAMPLTRRAKMLMLVQSAASLLLLVMVAARAVNILA
jgi:uncharacterized membrane protein